MRGLWKATILAVCAVALIALGITTLGGGHPCGPFAVWDRIPGSLAPYPEAAIGPTVERVTMLQCSGGAVRVEIERFDIQMRKK